MWNDETPDKEIDTISVFISNDFFKRYLRHGVEPKWQQSVKI